MKIVQRPADLGRARFSSAIAPLLARIYCARGVYSESQLPDKLNQLLPPDMLGMTQAVAVLAQALRDQKRMLILGDFDADGATSSALAVLSLRAMGARQVDFLVPNRFDYGYGLTPEIAAVALSLSPDLVITVDNGISSLAGARVLRDAGVQLVITDHHLPAEQLPEADAIVNPNQRGCHFASKNLAGVGVIFYVMSCLRSQLQADGWFAAQALAVPNMADFLDLVALGTVADVVPLDANNRLMVAQGIKRIRAGACRPGITALLTVAGRNPANTGAQDMGFAVGPRLNAAGRLDDMSLGIQCLLAQSADTALALAQQLDDFNRDRRAIEASMQQEAQAALAALDELDSQPWGISLFHPEWHQGVIGILASRVKDRYHRPVIIFADAGDGQLKGSGRSVQGLHLRDALDRVAVTHPGLISKFGGHAMAAGLTIGAGDFLRFQQAFDQVCRQLMDESMLQAVLYTDGELEAEDFSLQLARQLLDAGPWGQQFPEPCFEGQFRILQQRILKGKHLKMVVAPLHHPGLAFDAIAFGVDLAQWETGQITQARMVYRLDINEFRGQVNLQLMVTHLAP